jgi:hypothetical protein
MELGSFCSTRVTATSGTMIKPPATIYRCWEDTKYHYSQIVNGHDYVYTTPASIIYAYSFFVYFWNMNSVILAKINTKEMWSFSSGYFCRTGNGQRSVCVQEVFHMMIAAVFVTKSSKRLLIWLRTALSPRRSGPSFREITRGLFWWLTDPSLSRHGGRS